MKKNKEIVENSEVSEKVGVIWFRFDSKYDENFISETLVANFFKENEKITPGGKFHVLESREEAKKLIERLEKALGLSNKIELTKEGALILDKDNLPID